PMRKVRVPERTGPHDRPEVLVEHVDLAPAEIRGIQESVSGGVRGEGETLVDRPGRRVIHGEEGTTRIDDRGPARDGAILGGEEEAGGCGDAVPRDDEPASAVKDGAGGRAARAAGPGDPDQQRDRFAAPVQ